MKRILIIISVLSTIVLSGMTIVHAQEEKAIALHLEEHQAQITLQTFEYGEESHIEFDKGIFEWVDGETSIDTSTIHSKEVILTLLDIEYGREYDYEYSYEVVDTVAPELHGVEDFTMILGDTKRPNITASDKIDGDLEVVWDKEVDYTVEGTTNVKVSTSDLNGNIATDSLTVTVNPKPKPKPKPKVAPKPQYFGNQMVRFEQTQDVIPYSNSGVDGGMSYINANYSHATTWEIIGNKAHSNTDGLPTYFAAHTDGGFINLPKLKMGSIITIKDSSGHIQKYMLESSHYVGATPSSETTTRLDDPAVLERIKTFSGEGIVLQTCNPTNTKGSLYIAYARPIN